MKRWLVVSIWPKHSAKLLSGEKTAELRRVRPGVGRGDLVVVYATSPCRAIVGVLEVEQVVEGEPGALWSQHGARTGLTRHEYDRYYEGTDVAFAILVSRASPLHPPVSLDEVREYIPAFKPPQGYLYIHGDSPTGLALQQVLGENLQL